MPRVLIVEDDEVIGQGMAQHLAAAGFEPVLVSKGELGLTRLRYEQPDVCVLDLMLPGRDGWSVIETARAEGIGTPIVVVSARGTEYDRVHALELGADDYLVKPFSMKELVARVQAAARRGVRGQEQQRGEAIEIEELRIDPREVQAYGDGEQLIVTGRSTPSCGGSATRSTSGRLDTTSSTPAMGSATSSRPFPSNTCFGTARDAEWQPTGRKLVEQAFPPAH